MIAEAVVDVGPAVRFDEESGLADHHVAGPRLRRSRESGQLRSPVRDAAEEPAAGWKGFLESAGGGDTDVRTHIDARVARLAEAQVGRASHRRRVGSWSLCAILHHALAVAGHRAPVRHFPEALPLSSIGLITFHVRGAVKLPGDGLHGDCTDRKRQQQSGEERGQPGSFVHGLSFPSGYCGRPGVYIVASDDFCGLSSPLQGGDTLLSREDLASSQGRRPTEMETFLIDTRVVGRASLFTEAEPAVVAGAGDAPDLCPRQVRGRGLGRLYAIAAAGATELAVEGIGERRGQSYETMPAACVA